MLALQVVARHGTRLKPQGSKHFESNISSEPGLGLSRKDSFSIRPRRRCLLSEGAPKRSARWLHRLLVQSLTASPPLAADGGGARGGVGSSPITPVPRRWLRGPGKPRRLRPPQPRFPPRFWPW
eukprot:GHVT01027777.1.p2 GENE.GHVT01027777.1~~GHVT01027777.1.p2  ORF type:complete len:124 (-),score=18.32 GHVT01027777.1:131-502(-)